MRAHVVTLLVLAPLAACTGRPGDNSDSDRRAHEGEGEGEGGEGEGEGGEGEGEGEVVGADLILDALPASVVYPATYQDFASDACEVQNGLVVASGARALLQLTELGLKNVGTRDSTSASEPPVCGGNDVAPDFIEWRLSNESGVVASGRLAGPANSVIAPAASAVVAPSAANLVDVTDLPAGDYVLELEVDPDGRYGDANASNNIVSTRIPLVNMQCGGVVCGGNCCPGEVCVDDVCHLPDLSVDAEALFDTQSIQEISIGTNSCAMNEGCVEGFGDRRVLRFSTTTPNTGTEDLVMGAPQDQPDLFHYDTCHGHYHFQQYADYRLLNEDGTVAARGHKQAFCLIDLERRDNNANPEQTYYCGTSQSNGGYQGISVGWADTYSSELPCQWIDITGVPEGNYVLEVSVNPQRIFPEMNHTNNISRVPVFITQDPTCQPTDEVCGNGEDEDCDGDPDDGCAPITDNDTCNEAPNVEGSALYTGEITADNDSDVSPSCGGDGGDLFFDFNVPTAELVYLSTYGSDIDTTLAIYSNNGCAQQDETDCVDDGCGAVGAGGAHILREFVAGPYTAVVKAKNAGETGVVRLKIQQAGCAGALPLEGSVEGSTSDADDNTAASCAQPFQNGNPSGTGADELWYFSTCPGAHPADISTCGGVTQFDSLVEVRDGNCLGRAVDCDDDLPDGQGGCSEIAPMLQSNGAGDGLWFVLVDGYSATSEGAYSLSLDLQ